MALLHFRTKEITFAFLARRIHIYSLFIVNRCVLVHVHFLNVLLLNEGTTL